jgi:hypothetical protein
MCIVVSTGEQEVCEARTSEMAQLGREGPGGPWNIRKIKYKILWKNLPYSPVMPHMGHETGAGAYPSGGEHSARMRMTPIPLESLFN